MSPRKQNDLKRLSTLAFRRMEECSKVIEKYYDAPRHVRSNPCLKTAYLWMFVPFSLWPFDISGTANHLIDQLTAGKGVDEASTFLLNLLGELPIPSACEKVAEHEHQVKTGNYETLIKAQHKFDMKERELGEMSEFRADWERIKSLFNVAKHQGKNGVIRRRMASERNFRPPGWNFTWRTKADRFKLVFDAFCHKWVLYGMEYNKPLLQKLSVNITPLGTMIFIPRYWSLDHIRDLRWPAINRLHLARGVPRQGEKLGANQTERRHEAEAARKYWEEATQAGLKGDKRVQKVLAQLGHDPRTDAKQLRRLLKIK